MTNIRPDLITESNGQQIAVFKEADDTMTIYEVDVEPGFYRFIERLSTPKTVEKYGNSDALRKLAGV